MHACTEPYAGLQPVVLSGGGLTAVVLPDVGAKIVSLVSERTGREFVWRDPTRALGLVSPGSTYADNDASGCDYPAPPFAGLALGDHGDLWSRRWDVELDGDEALFTMVGETLPFTFQKRIRIDASTQALAVENTLSLFGAGPLVYQWTAHPLLRAEPGARIRLPPGTGARTTFSTGGRLAVDDTHWPWPQAPTPGGDTRDVSVVGQPDDGLNEKYWLTAPDHGCMLEFPGADEELHLSFSSVALPYLAICVNYGGWPEQNPGFWVAIEPSTSPYDSLEKTIQAGFGREIWPGETHLWTWSLRVARP